MIKIIHSGDFRNTERLLKKAKSTNLRTVLEQYGQRGVDALAAATPVDTGLTAASWTYSVSQTRNQISIVWSNTNNSNGIPIIVLIQYGHSANGRYVEGRDFINPAIQPLFDEIANELWREVTS